MKLTDNNKQHNGSNIESPKSRETFWGSKKIGRRAMLAALLCLLIVGVYLINAVFFQLNQRYSLSIDLTANAAYEVGRETKDLLGSLGKNVEIYVLARPDAFGGNSYFLQMQHIMELYPKISDKVSLKYIDFAYDPTFASKYPDLSLQQGDILVQCGDRVKQLRFSQMFNYYQSESGDLSLASSRAEEALTSAFINVLSENQVKVAVLTGGSTADLSPFTTMLTDNNYAVSNVNIATDPLDGYDAAMLFAPQVDLSEEILKKLGDFLYNNGKYGRMLFYTADASAKPLPNINTFLSEWGIYIGDGVVFETSAARTYQSQPFFPVTDYVNEKYRDMLKDPSMPVLMPVSRPMEQTFTVKGDISTDVLLSFGSGTGVMPPDAGKDFTIDKATLHGPFPAMIMSTKNVSGSGNNSGGKSMVLVSASTQMLDSYCIQNTSLANSGYMLNLFNDVFQRTDAVNIEPKSLAGRTLAVTSSDAGAIGIIMAGVVPLAILAAGIAIWLVRRYK